MRLVLDSISPSEKRRIECCARLEEELENSTKELLLATEVGKSFKDLDNLDKYKYYNGYFKMKEKSKNSYIDFDDFKLNIGLTYSYRKENKLIDNNISFEDNHH